MKYLVRDKVLAIGDDYWIEDEEGGTPSSSTGRPCGCGTPWS